MDRGDGRTMRPLISKTAEQDRFSGYSIVAFLIYGLRFCWLAMVLLSSPWPLPAILTDGRLVHLLSMWSEQFAMSLSGNLRRFEQCAALCGRSGCSPSKISEFVWLLTSWLSVFYPHLAKNRSTLFSKINKLPVVFLCSIANRRPMANRDRWV